MDEDFYYDEYDEEEEIETCSEGFNPFEFGECCGCTKRLGIEHCDFMCPFGSPPLSCLTRECCDSDEEYEWLNRLLEERRRTSRR